MPYWLAFVVGAAVGFVYAQSQNVQGTQNQAIAAVAGGVLGFLAMLLLGGLGAIAGQLALAALGGVAAVYALKAGNILK